MLNPFFPCTEESYIQPLSILHFFANLVAEYLVPVDFGAGNRKLPAQGFECGMSIEKFDDIKIGDFIECYIVEEQKA